MASISDIILGQVQSAAGNIQIPSNLQNTVLNGLSSSILGSLTQTATKAGGVSLLKDLFSGRTAAASSPVTALATNLFSNNVLSKLNLGNLAGPVTAVIPTVMGKLGGVFKDQDGDGDVDFNDIILALQGGGVKKALGTAAAVGVATKVLGGLFKKK